MPEGYVLEDAEGHFLSRSLEWMVCNDDCAYIHPGSLKEIKEMIVLESLPVSKLYPAASKAGWTKKGEVIWLFPF